MRGAFLRVLSCFVLPALAGCVGTAMEGANMAKDEVAYRNYIEAARSGDAEAQYRVGDALCCSLGDRQGFYDTRKSVEWLCRAAAQGYAPASRELGQIYSGDVVDGVRLLRRVAEGVSDRPEDPVVSYAWLKIAARQGASEAEADAEALWSELDQTEKARAGRLVAGGEPLPCHWDEVFQSQM